MSAASFDSIIHPHHRLRICAMLAAVDSVEFSTIRDELGVSDSVLSKQVKVLEDAGYVAKTKVPHNLRRRTWFYLTRSGRSALEAHLAELRRIAELTTS